MSHTNDRYIALYIILPYTWSTPMHESSLGANHMVYLCLKQ